MTPKTRFLSRNPGTSKGSSKHMRSRIPYLTRSLLQRRKLKTLKTKNCWSAEERLNFSLKYPMGRNALQIIFGRI